MQLARTLWGGEGERGEVSVEEEAMIMVVGAEEVVAGGVLVEVVGVVSWGLQISWVLDWGEGSSASYW